MIAKIKFFLYSSKYRKMVTRRVLGKLKKIVYTPVAYVQAQLRVRKFLNEHPDNWDRYAEWRRLENQVAENNQIREMMKRKQGVVHNMVQMQLWMITYIAKNDPENKNRKLEKLSLEDIERNFISFQENLLEGIEECKNLGAKVPDEFPEMVRCCKYDYCKSVPEFENFSEGMCSLLGNVDFGPCDLNCNV